MPTPDKSLTPPGKIPRQFLNLNRTYTPAPKSLSLKDLEEFSRESDDLQYARTCEIWRRLAIKLGHEGLRQALSGSKTDKTKLASVLTAAGIAHDKAWAKREAAAVLAAIPHSIEVKILAAIGVEVRTPKETVPTQKPLDDSQVVDSNLVSPDTEIRTPR